MLQKDQQESLSIIFEMSHQTIEELDDIIRTIPSPWRMSLNAGAGKMLGDLYMSIERILRLFIEDVYGEKIVKDEAWHKRLMDAGRVKGLLPKEVESSMPEMRRFRHRLMHGYGAEMDEAKLRQIIPEAIHVYQEVEKHIVQLFPELKRQSSMQKEKRSDEAAREE